MPAEWFRNWFGSPYYPILYKDRNDKEARQFIERLLHYLQPAAASRMLDIGCGEGRFARQLEGHDYNVTGFDLSQLSIERAKKFETAHLHFYVHDMRMPSYINYFNYAFNFFTSFGYFATQRDHLMAAKAFATALKPGGTLIIDYLNRHKVLADLKPEDTAVRGNYTFHIRRYMEDDHFIKEISFADAEGKARRYTERVAAFTLEDFTALFEKAGLTLVTTFGNYELKAFDVATSPRLIMQFTKPNATTTAS